MSKEQFEWNKRRYFFRTKEFTEEEKWQRLRVKGKKLLTQKAQLKLEWVIFYYTTGGKNAKETARYFGVTRKTIHKWLKRYEDNWLSGLEEYSTAPHTTRVRQISLAQRLRVRTVRTKYPKYGKMKLACIYNQDYGETISSWHIQKIIEEDNLYFDKSSIYKRRVRRSKIGIKRAKITKLVKEHKVNFLWHVDTVILTLTGGGYRYLLTAIDEVSKMTYARLYNTHTSRNAKDFLDRLIYVTDNKILNIHHDNGSEFLKEFSEACRQLNIPQWFSRPHTPRDNCVLERFNRTIQEEFVEVTDIDPYYTDEFNNKLTDWLIEYNFHRPHQALDYQTPLQYLDDYYLREKVSPMYSSRT